MKKTLKELKEREAALWHLLDDARKYVETCADDALPNDAHELLMRIYEECPEMKEG